MGRAKREPTATSKAFADALFELVQNKKDAGMSHEAISKAAGVASAALSAWLLDKSSPTIEGLYKLSKYFGVSADYLLGLTDVQTVNTDLRAVCEYTGLSECALEQMEKGKEFPEWMTALNRVLASETFYKMVFRLERYQNSLCAEKLFMATLATSGLNGPDVAAKTENNYEQFLDMVISVAKDEDCPERVRQMLMDRYRFWSSEDMPRTMWFEETPMSDLERFHVSNLANELTQEFAKMAQNVYDGIATKMFGLDGLEGEDGKEQ